MLFFIGLLKKLIYIINNESVIIIIDCLYW